MRREFRTGDIAWLTDHTAWAPYGASEHPEVCILDSGPPGTGLAAYYVVRVLETGEVFTHVHEANLLCSNPHKRVRRAPAPRPAPQEEALF